MNRGTMDSRAVLHLEYLFSPKGLPLIQKGVGPKLTTSVLVRGSAGAGKTTLALALALDFAPQGAVYFLATEASPTDARAKAEALDLAPAMIVGAPNAAVGVRVVVDHLAAHDEVADGPADERARRALDVAFAWVHARRAELDLRAVVVDTFSIVGARATPEDRTHVLQFIQAMEAIGVVPILVEEVGATAQDWTAYLVDVVFEVGWEQDLDTGRRTRKLAVPKSRYATARYGPHDYGREYGELAVWPPLAAVVEEDGPRDPPDIVFVLRTQLAASRANRVLSVSRSNTLDYVPLDRTRDAAWLPGVTVRIGTVVRVDGQTVASDAGPHAVGWQVIKWLADGGLASVTGLQHSRDRHRFHVPLLEDLLALAALGVVVCIQDAGPSAVPFDFDLRTGPGEADEECFGPTLEAPTGFAAMMLPTPEAGLPALFASQGGRRADLLYACIQLPFTRYDPPLDWLLKVDDKAEKKLIAPYVAIGLVRRERYDEARPWIEIALKGKTLSVEQHALLRQHAHYPTA